MSDTVRQAAALLLEARRDPGKRLAELPPELRPADRATAYAIQREVAKSYAAIGGWKVSPFLADGVPFCGPLPAAGIIASPAALPASRFTLRGIESEVSLRIAHDLPPRGTPYAREEVAEAIAAFHPAIEVLESRYLEPNAVSPMSGLADTQAHGAFVYGAPVVGWRDIDLLHESVVQRVDGEVSATRTGHPGGDLLGQVVWLANEGSTWAGGLKAGQFVTCGSWTGAKRVGPNARIRVSFSSLGEVALDFVD
jgi:2-keto-4-pentenoate hydratase